MKKLTNNHLLILPGLYNSGPKHWQSIWEKSFSSMQRVNQADWDTPNCNDWVEELNKMVMTTGENVTLIAHSLACTLVCKWAEKYPTKICGALLVAPSDTEADTYPKGTTNFSPMVTSKLPFSSIVVASTDDPYVSIERATYFANSWGSELVVVNNRGHINVDSNLGMWQEGLQLLSRISRNQDASTRN